MKFTVNSSMKNLAQSYVVVFEKSLLKKLIEFIITLKYVIFDPLLTVLKNRLLLRKKDA